VFVRGYACDDHAMLCDADEVEGMTGLSSELFKEDALSAALSFTDRMDGIEGGEEARSLPGKGLP
jgi:hypothetical protein